MSEPNTTSTFGRQRSIAQRRQTWDGSWTINSHEWRIVIAYLLMVSLFATLYYAFGFSHPPHINSTDAIILSITAFHGRVFSSPFQTDSPQGIVTAFEAITGLIFEGIFIAMLTQRFFNR